MVLTKAVKKHYKTIMVSGIGAVIVLFAGVFSLTYYLTGERVQHVPISVCENADDAGSVTGNLPDKTLKVMSLNLAHGRKDGTSQLLLKRKTIRANLVDIATVLKRVAPHVVALQEADAPSAWSGNFNHVKFLAEKADYKWYVQGINVEGLKLAYGTAIISRLKIEKASAYTFKPTPPTFSKGFVVADVRVPGTTVKTVTIVSVHLDFSRASKRRSQITEMIKILKTKQNPLIIIGDFNCDWTSSQSVLPEFCSQLNLKAYKPKESELYSFPLTEARLDWILISDELTFKSYKRLPDVLSDHLALVAEIELH